MKSRTVIVVVVCLLVGFVVSNRMSYQDGLDDQQFRCDMIRDGFWPDTNGYFDKSCKS